MIQDTVTQGDCNCYQDELQIVEYTEFVQQDELYEINLSTHKICFCLKGEINIVSENDNMKQRVESGEFVFLPVDSRVLYIAAVDSVMLSVRLMVEEPGCHIFKINNISSHINDYVDTYKNYRGIHTLKVNDRMQHSLTGLLEVFNDGFKCRAYMQLEISRILLLLHAYYPREELAKFFSSIMSPDIEFSEFIRLNFMKYKTVSNLASAINMTPMQFSRRFRKVFGMTPRDWIQREKARHIYMDICRSRKSLKEIAYEYEFSLQSNFVRFCRQHLGASPGVIRRQNLMV